MGRGSGREYNTTTPNKVDHKIYSLVSDGFEMARIRMTLPCPPPVLISHRFGVSSFYGKIERAYAQERP
jgi:hypothetical protein